MVTEEKQEHRIERNKGTWKRYGQRAKWPNRLAMIVGYAVVLVAIIEALQPDDPPPPRSTPVAAATPVPTAAPTRSRIESPKVVERPARPAPDPDVVVRQAYDCGRVALGKEPCKIVADGTLGCKDEDQLIDLFRMMASGDREAYMQAATVSLATQRCDVFTRGTEVFVEDTKVFNDTAYIRPKGQVSKYWVSRLALWDREET